MKLPTILTVSLVFCAQLLAAQFPSISLTPYTGGDGDGYTFDSDFTQLSIFDAGDIYTGGNNDGHSTQASSAVLTLLDDDALYTSGDGDGHSSRIGAVQLTLLDAADLYSGGDNDGASSLNGSALLDLLDRTALYSGGDNDGFSTANAFGNLMALPLALISFEAHPEDKYVLLKWVTTDEQDTDFFTIERTRDGFSFEDVGTTEAAGFSEPGEALHYELTDPNPQSGRTYYRLKTTDFDGTFSLSQLEDVYYGDTGSDWDYTVFPNPNSGEIINVLPTGIEASELNVELVDGNGRGVMAQTFGATTGPSLSSTTLSLRTDGRLSPGAYFLRVNAPGQGVISKMIIIQ